MFFAPTQYFLLHNNECFYSSHVSVHLLDAFFYFSAIDNDVWMSNSEAIYGSNNNNNNDDIINSDFHLNDETSKQRVKVRRKKVQGENPIKKYIVRRKNNDFAGPFLTTTTTTESPWVDNQALNRTQEDSRCESHLQLLMIKHQ
jgi:hypothetical protein